MAESPEKQDITEKVDQFVPKAQENPYLAPEIEREENLKKTHEKINPKANGSLDFDPTKFFLLVDDCTEIIWPPHSLARWIEQERMKHLASKVEGPRTFHLQPLSKMMEMHGRGYVNMIVGLEALEEKKKTVFVYCDLLQR